MLELMVKNLAANARDIRDEGLIPGSGRSAGGGHGYPLQYSCLKNPMDRGACWATVHGVAKSWTWLKQLSMHSIYYRPGSLEQGPQTLGGELVPIYGLLGTFRTTQQEMDSRQVSKASPVFTATPHHSHYHLSSASWKVSGSISFS